MSDEDNYNNVPAQLQLPVIKTNSPYSGYAYSKAVREAPYRALVGVIPEGKEIQKIPRPHCRVRNQTGLSNRWRLPQSLYSDMLGTAQAMKSVNMPFDQALVTSIIRMYPSVNPLLFKCQDFPDMNERNWSLLKKASLYKPKIEEDELLTRSLPQI